MSVTSILLHDGKVLAEWVENHALQAHFLPYAEAFTVIEDEVELPITLQDVNALISEIEDFLAGVAESGSITEFFTACALGDSKFSYRECATV